MMMMNIFSIFDPTSSYNMSLNWMSIFIFFLLMPFQYWILPSRLIYLNTTILNLLFHELKILINYSYSNMIFFMSMFTIIFYTNFLGLFPYIFTASTHLSFSLSLSLSLWISLMTYWIFNYLNSFFSHLTPQGTPIILMPFMVLIELTSLFIRPFTLAIRLTANMIAGHLLLSLLGSSGSSITSIIMILLMMFIQIILFILEIAVSLIQSYVFTILSTLYSSEI
uniref:ATP synthase subunit a n=1 Tax=Pristomyrmex punctatus TaxID=507543 RepID=E5RPZ8_9HYME|nr:ATP synthase F0 subunit 6 [Pristomyrmex punctatus]BAJ53351.1 ATP synthase subunit 6 [Pristomyrmex punctatus]BAJ53364.1 ATP synthase subunit 6 [Pristomyrmex punctatus]